MKDYNSYDFIGHNSLKSLPINPFLYEILDEKDVENNKMLISKDFELWFPLEQSGWNRSKWNIKTKQMTEHMTEGLSELSAIMNMILPKHGAMHDKLKREFMEDLKK